MKQKRRRISTSHLVPGMKLAKAFVTDSATALLIAENTRLSVMMVEKIQASGIPYVDVIEDASDSRESKKTEEEQQFAVEYTQVFETTKKVYDSVRVSKVIPKDVVDKLANDVVLVLQKFPRVIRNLQQIKKMDDYTYTHSLNVGIICGLFAKQERQNIIKEYVLAGLLHDIGKTQISLQILNKPALLSPEEMKIMQAHALKGWELAWQEGYYSEESLNGILQHHERLDGSGYPFCLVGEEISMLARVIALADTFDAMTSNRIYRKAVTPFIVMQEIFSAMFNKLDPQLCIYFLNNLRDQLTGSLVVLQNGMQAKVAWIDDTNQYLPILHSLEGDILSQQDVGFYITEIID